MKKILASIILTSQLFASGIPVVDIVGNAQQAMQNAKQVAEWVETATRWTEQVAHFKNQLKAYKDQLMSQTGLSKMVGFIKDGKEIYGHLAKARDNIKSFNEDVLQNPAGFFNDEFVKQYRIFDRCQYLKGDRLRLCQASAVSGAMQIKNVNQALEEATSIEKAFKKLSNALANAKTAKEASDIGNAIQTQVGRVSMLTNQMKMQEMSYNANERIMAEQARQLEIKRSFTHPRY